MYKSLYSLLARADWNDDDVDMIYTIVNKNPEFLTKPLRDNFCGKCSVFRDRLTCKCGEVITYGMTYPSIEQRLTLINRCAFLAEIRRLIYCYAGNRDVKLITRIDGYLSLIL